MVRAPSPKIFTKEELKAYDGSVAGKGPYLALMGEVFDVSSKVETYGPDGGYGFFRGASTYDVLKSYGFLTPSPLVCIWK